MLHIQLTRAEYLAARAALRMYHEQRENDLHAAQKARKYKDKKLIEQLAKVVDITESAMAKFGIQ